jgi:hypothetical protein
LENRCTGEKSGGPKKVNERPKGFVGENLSASERGESKQNNGLKGGDRAKSEVF